MNEALHAVSGILQPFVDHGIMSGAVVAIADRERALLIESVGYSNLEVKKPMQDDDLFWIASMTKPMTGTALMMLVEEGRVCVDDPVEKYLPEFKDQKVRDENGCLREPVHPITIRNALTHTAGLSFCSTRENEIGKLDRLPLQESVLGYSSEPLRWDPDSKYDYANEGTNIAGRIIEVTSGMPYEKFMEQRLFTPLGMKSTTFWPEPGKVVASYRTNETANGLEEVKISQLSYPLDNRTERFPFPAGGLFSTASDVLKFGQMILCGGEREGRKYLSQASIREMGSKQTAPSIETAYGYGWDIGEDQFGHAGAYKTQLRIFPHHGVALVSMVQQANGWMRDGDTLLPRLYQAAKELGSAQ